MAAFRIKIIGAQAAEKNLVLVSNNTYSIEPRGSFRSISGARAGTSLKSVLQTVLPFNSSLTKTGGGDVIQLLELSLSFKPKTDILFFLVIIT